jgi:hypothetical protein
MQAAQAIGIDLPLKALVWQDASATTWLSYNDQRGNERERGRYHEGPGSQPEIVVGTRQVIRLFPGSDWLAARIPKPMPAACPPTVRESDPRSAPTIATSPSFPTNYCAPKNAPKSRFWAFEADRLVIQKSPNMPDFAELL